MMVHVQVKERMKKYMENDGDGARIKEAALNLYLDQSVFETSNCELTIIKRTGTVEMVKPILTNLFMVAVLFMIFLGMILNQSLV